MIKKWTSDQRKAIYSTGGTVLVSAAAGSGKTSVLVQRVINRITNKLDPTDIDKLLIVTFTNAAAQEMSSRISEGISELIRKDPYDLNLQRQQLLLKQASIGTIHSFCNSLLKENFYKAGISPNFRIARESEINILKRKAMETTFEHFYKTEDDEFLSLIDIFTNEKGTENFSNVVEKVFNFTESVPFPKMWFKNVLDLYKSDEMNDKITAWQKIIIQYSIESFEAAINLMSQCILSINSNEELKKNYLSDFEKDLLSIKEIKSLIENMCWDEALNKISGFSFSRLSPFRDANLQEEKALIISKRNYVKDILEGVKKYFCFSQDEIYESLELLYPKTAKLFEVVTYFTEEFQMLKFSKDLLDFSDLERLTLNLLVNEEGSEFQKSELAEEISKKYKEVMVDEYQDINEVQEMIFKLITDGEKNLFMVGDVKQSIYKFRQSRPDIFLKKKNTYLLYNEEKPVYPSKIILGENFRSKKSIIDSINFIFKCLMSKRVGDVDYNDEEKLFCGSEYSENNDQDFILKLIDTSSAEDREEEERLEAKEISKIILKTVSDGYKISKGEEVRNVNYSDFCILLRSSNDHAHIYAQELEANGIPTYSETNNSFLNTLEISTILSLLKVINNPINDIALVSVLLSPLFGFNLDELNSIRQAELKVPFYFALRKYSENGDPHIKYFIDKIDYYRKISTTLSCEELISYIYQDTGYPTLCAALPKGKLKKANLLLFKDYARKFDHDSRKSLNGFLNFIENIQQTKSDLPSASVFADSENAVKIMSIHKSKGLEFPIIILAGCSRKFFKDNESIIIHPNFGLGMKLKNSENTFKYNNIVYQVISLMNKFEDISEEMRVFYVALTRARQKIVIVSSVKNVSKLEEKLAAFFNQSMISPYEVKTADSFLEWLLLCISVTAERKKLCEALNFKCKYNNKDLKCLNWSIEWITCANNEFETQALNDFKEDQEYCNSLNEDLLNKIRSRIEFKYPFERSLNIPVRISASKLSHKEEWCDRIAESYPDFISAVNFSPTAKGTATHKFLCHMNFKRASLNLNDEIEYLDKKGFFLNYESDLLDRKSIKRFMNSEIYRRILKSSEVLREHRFSVKMPLNKIHFFDKLGKDKNEENHIILQGAIDCVFKEEDGYVILDYKTDKASCLEELYTKYRFQLEIYKYAFEESKNLKVKEMGIYSFYLSDYYPFN